MSSANPPQPPPYKSRRKHSAKKADHAPDPYKVSHYLKNKNGKYWFHYITDEQWAEKPKAWKTAIQRSIPNYLGCMIMSGNISKEGTDEYEIYCKAANAYADSH